MDFFAFCFFLFFDATPSFAFFFGEADDDDDEPDDADDERLLDDQLDADDDESPPDESPPLDDADESDVSVSDAIDERTASNTLAALAASSAAIVRVREIQSRLQDTKKKK